MTLMDRRVLLNCCGVHDLKIIRRPDGSLITHEIDAYPTSRCDCLCVFDFKTEVEEFENAPLSLVIFLDVEENGPQSV